MKKFVSILLVIIMCLSYHFILIVHASTLDAKSDSAVMQEGKSTQARTDKTDSTDGSDTKDDAASGVSMSEVSLCIAQNGKQLLILTDYSPVKQADDIIVTFNEGTQADASLKEKDETTGLAVIAVELDTLNEDFLKNDITIATFGSSNIKDIAGLPVVALGRPMGTNGSLGYGIITSSASESAASDTTYRILQTNIVGSQNAGGVLFNLQGQVIGIITNGKSATDMKNMVCAYGITELKRHIEKMSNGEKFAYLGLKGVDVTEEANSELGVPYGAYITEVEMDSPAMLAGIQQGDVITGFGERMIVSFDEYTNSLLSMKPGDSVELTIMRQSQQEYKEMKFDITLTVLK